MHREAPGRHPEPASRQLLLSTLAAVGTGLGISVAVVAAVRTSRPLGSV